VAFGLLAVLIAAAGPAVARGAPTSQVKGPPGPDLTAVRAHLQEMAGDLAGATATYRKAARATTSLPEKRYLEGRAARLTDPAT
jgi:hypothetical protein